MYFDAIARIVSERTGCDSYADLGRTGKVADIRGCPGISRRDSLLL